MPLAPATALTTRQAIVFISIFLLAATVVFGVASSFFPKTFAAGGDSVENAQAAQRKVSVDDLDKATNAYGKLPLTFARNEGQADQRVRFISRGPGYGLFLTADEAVLKLRSGADRPTVRQEMDSTEPAETLSPEAFHVVRMRLIGVSSKVAIEGEDEFQGKLNYFIGNDFRKWRKNISTYAQVRYSNVYPGIDLLYHGNQRQLEYDFVIAPGASPKRIKLAFSGAEKIAIDRSGDLVLTTAVGIVRQPRPFAYQDINGERRKVAAGYRLRAGKVSFEVGPYDKTRALIIDPVLLYSSFLGGSGSEQGLGIAVDSQGNAYLTGSTGSADFPLAGGFQNVKDSAFDAFVVKVNAAGTALVYSTYLGGNADDIGNAIAVDASGSAYVVGVTASGSFPRTPGTFQDSRNGSVDGFVTKLSPDGASLSYSTFLGGDNVDFAYGIALDATGSAHVVGRTDSTRFSLNPLQRNGSPAYKSGNSGALWSASSNGLTASTVNSFAQDPVASNTIYAGTNYGVFKSTDAGGNWTLTGTALTSTAPIFTNAIVIDPSNPNILYAGAFSGIHKSTDGGSLYEVKNSGFLLPSVQALAIDPNTPTTLYAGTLVGIYKSINGGDTWVEIKGGITGNSPRVNEVLIDPSNSSILYMGTSFGLYKTTNGGTLWTRMTSAPFANNQITALAINPLNPLTLYAAVVGASVMYKTVDGGATWAASETGLTFIVAGQTFRPQINTLAIDPVTPSTLYAASSNGMYQSINSGASWSHIQTGLPQTAVFGVLIDRTNPATIYAGTAIGNDVFAAKLNASGSAVDYLTSFGGSESDEARGVALDSDGNAYIAGTTSSTNFPVLNAFQSASGGFNDAFVTKLNSTGSGFIYSSYLGGTLNEQGRAIAVRAGGAYVVGSTSSGNFPLITSIGPAPLTFDTDAFVTKVNPSGASLDFSSCLGGESTDQGFGVALDLNGSVYVTGSTISSTFPSVAALQPSSGGGSDAFVCKLNAAGTALVYSTYLGGFSSDNSNGIAVDPSGNAYIIGNTTSSNFPTVGAFQSIYKGNADAFITKLGPSLELGLTMSDAPDPVAFGSDLTYTINVRNNGELPATGVTLSDTLPSGSTLVSVTTTRGMCSGTTSITCLLGAMNAGEEATVQIIIKPPALSSISNTATVTSNEVDPVPGNNTATVQTQVDFADLSLTGATAINRVAPNGRITYLFNVKNLSGRTANSVTFTDNLPAGTTFVSCSAQGGVCGGSANNRTVTFASLTVGQSAAIVLVATVDALVAEGTILNNTATVSSAVPDPDPSNNSATSVVTVTNAPQRRKLNGLIAFSAESMFTVKADASEAPIPFPGPSGAILPSWSPDGARLAFTVRKNRTTFPFDTITAIEVVNADSTGLVTLADNVIDTSFDNRSRFAWSPDGTRLVYVGADRFIYLANADGSGYVKLPNSPSQVRDIDWSADGSRFVFSKDFGEIYVMNIDGSGLTKLVSFGTGPDGIIRYFGPTWSPDMTRILFTGDTNNGSDVFIMNADGTGQQRLLNRGFTSAPAWSPDGARLSFYNGTDVYVIDLDGTDELRLAKTPNCCNFGSISWQPIPTNTPLPPPGPPSPTFTISGHITNSNGTNGSALLKLSGTRSGFISSDAAGNYIIVNLPPGGTYTITPVSFFGKYTPPTRTFANLQGNQTGADFVETTVLHTIKGRLTNTLGQGLGGEPVSLMRFGTRKDTTTDGQGFYTFANTFPGDGYSVIPFSPTFSFDPTSSFFLSVFSDQTVNFVGSSNDSVRSLGGRITDSNGRSFSGQLVTLSGARQAVTKTNSDGHFSFRNLPIGQNYTMSPSTAGGFSFSPPQQSFTNLTSNPSVSFTATAAQPSVQFSAPSYTVGENGRAVEIIVTRTSDLAQSGAVDYETSELTASERTDYTASFGTLRFASGEASRSFFVLVSDDAFVEGARTFSVTLSNGSGVVLGANSAATVIISDDDTTPSSQNLVDEASFFVRQHYADFLNRAPDDGGLDFWTNQITSCGSDLPCREIRRINVSGAFFLSIEFQETGYLVYRIHHAAYGTAERLRVKSFLRDTQEIGHGVVVGVGNWQEKLEANKQAFLDAFVLRPEFTSVYPASMSPAQFVDLLNAHTGAALSTSERDQLVTDLSSGSKTRSQVLRAVAENQELSRRQLNRAFVLMQYFGYLRRNPDDPPDSDFAGHAFWLGKLEQFNGNYINAEMVKAFLDSTEYRRRFGTP